MPIQTRSNRSVSEFQTKNTKTGKMAATTDLSLQDVIDQMKESMGLLEKKIEAKIYPN